MININKQSNHNYLIYYKSTIIGKITVVFEIFQVTDNFGTLLYVSRNLEDAIAYAKSIMIFENYKKELLERISAMENAFRYEDSQKTIDLTFEDRE